MGDRGREGEKAKSNFFEPVIPSRINTYTHTYMHTYIHTYHIIYSWHYRTQPYGGAPSPVMCFIYTLIGADTLTVYVYTYMYTLTVYIYIHTHTYTHILTQITQQNGGADLCVLCIRFIYPVRGAGTSTVYIAYPRCCEFCIYCTRGRYLKSSTVQS